MRGDLSAANSSRLTNGSKLQKESEDPKTQIYNQILLNIKNEAYDTKTEFYKIGKVIGKGAFGKVNLAIHRLTGKFVALKSISKQMMSDESSLKKVRQEYNILKKARHQNIVRLYESFDTESHIVYVMEVCGGGDLLTYVRRRRKLKEDYAKFLFGQIIKGLQYVHSKGVLHRDIKLDNILLTSEGEVKICDFGVSKLVSSKMQVQTEQCGTPAYIAPEVFRGKGYKGFQSDIWSAGVVLYAMLYGTVPFKATNMAELQQQIINVQCSWGQPNDISPQALAFLKRILEADPVKRLTPEQILADPWMQQTEA
jgi:serine/threonine protein kinase